MERAYYQELARQGLAMPIGTHLVLHEHPQAREARMQGEALAEVIVETARRFRTPLAFPLMDLQIEKEDLMGLLGRPGKEADAFHFPEEGPTEEEVRAVERAAEAAPATPKMVAGGQAIARVAEMPGLVPVGMCIGPFSLFTKLFQDPIPLVFAAALSDPEEAEALAVARALEVSTTVILRNLAGQVAAGARAVCLCEPACNLVYLSPRQMEAEPELIDRFVLRYLRRIRAFLEDFEVDLILHDCGEINPRLAAALGGLDPAILSLGSAVRLWEMAPHVPERTVLFGNLPSKRFFSDAEYPESQLEADMEELRTRMAALGRPFILGSECDVLAVDGWEEAIWRKVHRLARGNPFSTPPSP